MFEHLRSTKPQKLCPHCREERLCFQEEILNDACLTCLYGKKKGADKVDDAVVEIYEPEKKIHPLISTVEIPSKIHAQLMAYCKYAPGEVSGLGEIRLEGDKAIVTSVALLKQECTSASTEISEDAISQFIYALAKRGRSSENWKVWWHTHHDFQTFWSMVDEENIRKLCRASGTYLISVELNKEGHMIARLDEKRTEFELGLTIKGPVYKDISNKCKKQIQRMVKTPQFRAGFGLPTYYNNVDYSYRPPGARRRAEVTPAMYYD